MANLQKKSIVDSLIEAIKTANFALITFEKTTHGSLEKLRRDLKKQDTSFKVIKNVLFEKAVNKLVIASALIIVLTAAIGIVFIYMPFSSKNKSVHLPPLWGRDTGRGLFVCIIRNWLLGITGNGVILTT